MQGRLEHRAVTGGKPPVDKENCGSNRPPTPMQKPPMGSQRPPTPRGSLRPPTPRASGAVQRLNCEAGASAAGSRGASSRARSLSTDRSVQSSSRSASVGAAARPQTPAGRPSMPQNAYTIFPDRAHAPNQAPRRPCTPNPCLSDFAGLAAPPPDNGYTIFPDKAHSRLRDNNRPDIPRAQRTSGIFRS